MLQSSHTTTHNTIKHNTRNQPEINQPCSQALNIISCPLQIRNKTDTQTFHSRRDANLTLWQCCDIVRTVLGHFVGQKPGKDVREYCGFRRAIRFRTIEAQVHIRLGSLDLHSTLIPQLRQASLPNHHWMPSLLQREKQKIQKVNYLEFVQLQDI